MVGFRHGSASGNFLISDSLVKFSGSVRDNSGELPLSTLPLDFVAELDRRFDRQESTLAQPG